MKTETIVMCVVALILGMLMANMLKSVCGCKSTVVEGQHGHTRAHMVPRSNPSETASSGQATRLPFGGIITAVGSREGRR